LLFFLYSVDVGGATTGDMNTANVDEDEENAEDKDERKRDDDDDDDDDDGDFVNTFVDNTKKKPPAPTPAASTRIEKRDVAAAADDDEEYVPSNDERDSNSEDIETGMGERTVKPKRKASIQNSTSRASAKRAKTPRQRPKKRYLFFLPRIFASF